MTTVPYLSVDAIEVRQPLGSFFVASIKARDLLRLTYSIPASVGSGGLSVEGTQRIADPKRLKEISNYISTSDSCFPNSIIIGANYTQDGEFVGSEPYAWTLENGKLIVPTDRKLGSIIDGQHRLFGFENCLDKDRDYELLCAIYLDLPVPYHAYIFSTINFNQKKVDRSLAYNLFGFDIGSSSEDTWVPETVAVSISRQINVEKGPFFGRVSLGLQGVEQVGDWKVSMATIVDGILKLISKNPKNDRHKLLSITEKRRFRKELGDDGSPLRILYLEGFDTAIKEIVQNYFSVLEESLWSRREQFPYVVKTVGIQGAFDALAELLKDFSKSPHGDIEYFQRLLVNIPATDFSDAQASGIGRSYIKNQILGSVQN